MHHLAPILPLVNSHESDRKNIIGLSYDIEGRLFLFSPTHRSKIVYPPHSSPPPAGRSGGDLHALECLEFLTRNACWHGFPQSSGGQGIRRGQSENL